jgi:hypothetical protein
VWRLRKNRSAIRQPVGVLAAGRLLDVKRTKAGARAGLVAVELDLGMTHHVLRQEEARVEVAKGLHHLGIGARP